MAVRAKPKKRKPAAKKRRKSPVKRKKKTTAKTMTLIPQPQGGALRPGGTQGNRGGTGRPPSTIRDHCRGSFAERVAILEAIADGQPLPMTRIVDGETVNIRLSAAIKERTQAIDLLGKYGGVAELALTVEEQPEEAHTPERAARLWAMLQRIKSVAALEKLLVDHAKKQLGRGSN